MSVRLLIDARKLGDFGIGVYIENLVAGLLDLRRQGEIDVELSLLVPPAFLQPGIPLGIQECIARFEGQVRFVRESAKKYSIAEYIFLGGRQRSVLEQIDLYHSPHYTLPFFLGVPSVVTIHDVIHITQPETPFHRFFAGHMIRSAVRRASHIISVSEESSRLIKAAVGPFTTPLSVVSNALQDGFGVVPQTRVLEKLRQEGIVSDGYCLFVGNEKPHKGFRELVGAWLMLQEKQKVSGGPLDLLVVGGKFSEASLDFVERCGLSSKVRFLGKVSKDVLCNLYNGAQAVVVPSREEGFGLVALEALACGAPLVCTPHASSREVCGDCAWFTEGYDSAAIAETLQRTLESPDLRKLKVNQGLSRVRRFGRESSARDTWKIYSEVLGLSAQLDKVQQVQWQKRSTSSFHPEKDSVLSEQERRA